MIRVALAIGFSCACLLAAEEDSKQKLQVRQTERLELGQQGTVRVEKFSGSLTVEGWDEPSVEITTVKSTKDDYSASDRDEGNRKLDRVKITAERRDDQIVVTTVLPDHASPPLPRYTGGVDLEYHLKVPRNIHLVIDQGANSVFIDDVRGDIDAQINRGALTLHLPQEGQYDIDAKTNLGHVMSEFPGKMGRRTFPLGHDFVQPASSVPKLHLRVGYGDITILKIVKPSYPGPLTH